MIDTNELELYLKYRGGTLSVNYPLTKHGFIVTDTQATRVENGKPTEKRTWPANALSLFVRPGNSSAHVMVVADSLAIPLYGNTVLSMTSRFGTFTFASSDIRNS